MRQLYILKCALTQKLRQLLCPSSHTTFHWAPPLSLLLSHSFTLSCPSLLPFPFSSPLSVVFLHGICGGAMAKVQSDSHWIICLGIVALFRFPFSFHVLLFFSFFPFFQCICCCCMKVGQGNAGAALELIGLGSLCATDSCRRRYGKQKVCPRRSQVRTKKILCNR